jgi:hypothetical protein
MSVISAGWYRPSVPETSTNAVDHVYVSLNLQHTF